MQSDNIDLVENQIQVVIDARIAELISSPVQAIVEFPPFLGRRHRKYVHSVAKSKGLNCTTLQQHGVKYVKVCKQSCGELPKLAPNFRLTDMSRKVIFHHLKNDPSCSDKDECDETMISSSQKNWQLKIPEYRFCAGTINKDILSPPPKSRNKLAEDLCRKMPIYQYRSKILDTISRSPVTILYGDSIGERTTQVPQYLLEEFASRNANCSIICVLDHKLSAVHCSEVVSSQRAERLGLTVGYQIHLESMSSMSTNLLYTTSSFFLRCLMGKNQDTFATITHVIVEDISEGRAHGEMLLHEIREAILVYPRLKLILMSGQANVETLQTYFKECTSLDIGTSTRDRATHYVEEIQHWTSDDFHKLLTNKTGSLSAQSTCKLIDEILTNCMDYDSEVAFEHFISLLRENQVDINARHSQTKITFAMAAARYDHLNYLMMFVSLGGDLLCTDVFNKSAIEWAQASNSESCLEFLHDKTSLSAIPARGLQDNIWQYQKSGQSNIKWESKDRELVFKVIKYAHLSTKSGTILAILPSFRDVVKQEFLVKQKIAQGLMAPNIKIYLLHNNTQMAEYRQIFQAEEDKIRKVVFATDLPLSTLALKNVSFIIDSGRKLERRYCNDQSPHKLVLSWLSQNCAMRRASLSADCGFTHCFRIYTRQQFKSFEKLPEPELNKAPLETFCLYAKLLAPKLSVKEYFMRVREDFPSKTIERAVCLLQTIEAFDEAESITPLGVRLVDIPVNIQLAKVLIFSILLQCLDPAVTIVSMLACQHSSKFLRKKNECGSYEDCSSSNSDHLLLLRMYQGWTEHTCTEKPLTEDSYVLNAELEIISVFRSHVIGVLRAAGLIHSNGVLNIHFINQRADNWALVKAAFVAGMHPNICRIDRTNNNINKKNFLKVAINKNSALGDIEVSQYQTDWIIHQMLESTGAYDQDKITCNTLVTSISIAIFAGSFMSPQDEIKPLIEDDSDSDSESYDSSTRMKCARYCVNEWITFVLDIDDAYMLFEFRLRFVKLFADVVDVCDDADKIRKMKNALCQQFTIVESISHVLQLEEQANNLPEPKGIGERPNALSSKFTKNQDKIAILKQSMMESKNIVQIQIQLGMNHLTNKSFFVLNVLSKEESRSYFEKRLCNGSDAAWRQITVKYRQFPTANILVFLLLNDCRTFCGVAQLCCNGEKYYLNEIANRDVSVNALKTIYYTKGSHYPGCYNGQELDTDIGRRFLELFL